MSSSTSKIGTEPGAADTAPRALLLVEGSQDHHPHASPALTLQQRVAELADEVAVPDDKWPIWVRIALPIVLAAALWTAFLLLILRR